LSLVTQFPTTTYTVSVFLCYWLSRSMAVTAPDDACLLAFMIEDHHSRGGAGGERIEGRARPSNIWTGGEDFWKFRNCLCHYV
jgi:hypothetical protein